MYPDGGLRARNCSAAVNILRAKNNVTLSALRARVTLFRSTVITVRNSNLDFLVTRKSGPISLLQGCFFAMILVVSTTRVIMVVRGLVQFRESRLGFVITPRDTLRNVQNNIQREPQPSLQPEFNRGGGVG